MTLVSRARANSTRYSRWMIDKSDDLLIGDLNIGNSRLRSTTGPDLGSCTALSSTLDAGDDDRFYVKRDCVAALIFWNLRENCHSIPRQDASCHRRSKVQGVQAARIELLEDGKSAMNSKFEMGSEGGTPVTRLHPLDRSQWYDQGPRFLNFLVPHGRNTKEHQGRCRGAVQETLYNAVQFGTLSPMRNSSQRY